MPNVPSSAAPVWVTGLGPGSGVTALVANGFDTCAIVNSGQWCWGDDTYGQLGNGSSGIMKNPVPVQPAGFGNGVQGIAVGRWDPGLRDARSLSTRTDDTGRRDRDRPGFPGRDARRAQVP